MFAGYNKNNARGALVGNWVEEDALRTATGYSRRKVPEPSSPEYKKGEATFDRVLHHSHATPASHYESTTQASTRYGDGIVKSTPAPRAAQREQQLLQLAKEIETKKHQALVQDIPVASMNQSTYQSVDPSYLSSVSRIPRGRNGSRQIDESVKDLPKSEVDALDRMKLEIVQNANNNYTESVAVTRYSHAIATGVGLNFPVTSCDGSKGNPFARSSAFTNDIRDPTKRHAEAMEPGSAHDAKIGFSAHQKAAWNKFYQFLSGSTTTNIIQDYLLPQLHAQSQEELVSLPVFRQVFLSIPSLPLNEKEIIQIFMSLDYNGIGAINLQDLIEKLA